MFTAWQIKGAPATLCRTCKYFYCTTTTSTSNQTGQRRMLAPLLRGNRLRYHTDAGSSVEYIVPVESLKLSVCPRLLQVSRLRLVCPWAGSFSTLLLWIARILRTRFEVKVVSCLATGSSTHELYFACEVPQNVRLLPDSMGQCFGESARTECKLDPLTLEQRFRNV